MTKIFEESYRRLGMGDFGCFPILEASLLDTISHSGQLGCSSNIAAPHLRVLCIPPGWFFVHFTRLFTIVQFRPMCLKFWQSKHGTCSTGFTFLNVDGLPLLAKKEQFSCSVVEGRCFLMGKNTSKGPTLGRGSMMGVPSDFRD